MATRLGTNSYAAGGRKRTKTLAVVVACFWFTSFRLFASVVVTFDPPLLSHGSVAMDSYTQNGVVFTGSLPYSFSQTDTGVSGRPDDGTAHLDILRFYTQFQFQNGGLFNLNQFDVAEYSSVFASSQTIQLTGTKADNSTVSFAFSTDGIFDGTGPLADFQTIVFPAPFTNLKSVSFGTNATFTLDNVMLTSVPEPATFLWVLGTSLALLSLRSRKLSFKNH